MLDRLLQVREKARAVRSAAFLTLQDYSAQPETRVPYLEPKDRQTAVTVGVTRAVGLER